MHYQPLRYNDEIISKYSFFNKIPIVESFFHIPQDFLKKQLPQIIRQLPKNIIVYSKEFSKKFSCNFLLAKAAFPLYFEKNIETLLSKRTDQKIRNEIMSKYPALNNIFDLIKKKEELDFEKLSFENPNQENFFIFKYPNADRSEKRKNIVFQEINLLSSKIQQFIETNNINILYVPVLNSMNVDKIERFLCNPINIHFEMLPPSPIDSNFFEQLFNPNFLIKIHDDHYSENIFVGPILGSFFSNIIANTNQYYLDINVSNAYTTKKMLYNLFCSDIKIILKYSQYPILKEIAKKFESKYLKKCIECFKSNLADLDYIFQQCSLFIDLQEKIFDLNDDNFQETFFFIQSQIHNPDLKHEIAFQIELASALRPKYNKLFKQLYTQIKEYVDPNFSCETYQYLFTKLETILIDDDSSSLLEFLSKNIDIDANQIIDCHCPFCKNATLMAASCFYGAINCFKFLQSNGADIDLEYLLDYAIAGGNIEIIHLLDITNEDVISGACQTAARFHRNAILEWLIEQEIDNTPFLISASEHSNFKAAKIYFDNNFQQFINDNEDNKSSSNNNRSFSDDNEINRALHKSLKHNCFTYFRFLLNFPGADIDNSFLIPAISSKSIQILDLVISFGNIDFKNSIFLPNEEIILAAIKTGRIDIIDKILSLKEMKKSIEKRIFRRDEFAEEILRTRNKQIIQKFIHFGNIFHYPFSIEELICKLVSNNDINLIQKIVDKSYFQCRKDWSPFPLAKSYKMVLFLLDCKSDPNFCNVDGDTCLSNAIKNNNKQIIQILLQNGASIRTVDYEGASPEIQSLLKPYYDSHSNI